MKKEFAEILLLLMDMRLIIRNKLRTNSTNTLKQAGTGPSRRHIQGSKIAKRLPSVKYSFTVLENRKFFEITYSKKWTEWRTGAR